MKMRKYLYRLVSLFLVIAHLVVFCARDLALAADNSAKGTSAQPSVQKEAKGPPPANFVPNEDLSEAIKDNKKRLSPALEKTFR